MAAADSGGVSGRPVPVTEGLAASAVPADPAAAQAASDWDAGRALAELYAVHYRALVRLAALLVRDMATTEAVVKDSFVAMHGEALVQQYYSDLPEAEIASAKGISQGAVKSHVFRAMSALRGELGPDT